MNFVIGKKYEMCHQRKGWFHGTILSENDTQITVKVDWQSEAYFGPTRFKVGETITLGKRMIMKVREAGHVLYY